MKKLPTWLAMGEILAVLFVTLSVASIIVYAPFWMIGGLFKSRRRPAERDMRRFPLLAVLGIVAFVATVILCGDDLIVRLGNLTVWSVALWAETLIFALASVAGFFVALQRPGEGVRRGVRRFSLIVSVALLIATVYLTYWGIIGMRTWA